MAEAPDRETGWSLRECTHALGGLRRLDPLFLGGAVLGGVVALWVVGLRPVVSSGGAACRLPQCGDPGGFSV